jgi:hypothetical protein
MTKLTYTPHSLPSQAILTGDSHFILLMVRAGHAESSYADREEVVEVTREIEKIRKTLKDQEYLMLRGIWFDDKHGGYRINVDLLHDQNNKPSMTIEDIKEALHDGYGWPDGQAIAVDVRIIPEFVYGDGFFPNADEYYRGLQFWKDVTLKPGDQFYTGHGEWK